MKKLKCLRVIMTALFIISTWIAPIIVHSGGLKFGIISVVKDKIEELKQKKKEKEERDEKKPVNYYESTTDSDGVASFILDNGETASVKVIDQRMGDALSSIKVFLITDGDTGAYFLVDSEGKYIPKIANASVHETQSQGTYRAKGIPWGNLAEIGLEFLGEITGVRPHPLYSEEIPEYIYNAILTKFFVSYKSTQLKELPPTLEDYANMVIEPVLGAGATAAICSVVPGIGTIVGGLAAGIALAAIKISEEAWSAGWYAYYKYSLGYSDDDWFDIYRPSSKWLTLIGQAFVILYPRASVPPCEATNSIGGVITEYATGKHLAGVEVILDPRPYSVKATLYTGLTGTYLFKEVRDPAFYGTKSFYVVTAKKKGYYNGYIYGVEPGTVDANISLAPRITGKNPPKTPNPPSGPSTGTIGISYSFSTSATDPDGDKVQYHFDWGDGSISEYTSLVNSGSSASKSHSYSSGGTYYIMAQARDSEGATSGWSGSHSITIIGMDDILYHESWGGGIYKMNLEDNSIVELSTFGWYAKCTADFERIAFGNYYNRGIWTMNSDGTNKSQLSSVGGAPSWSPDGNKICYYIGGVYTSERRIWIMNSDGSNQHQLSNTPGSFPKWSPDGSKIIYHGEESTGIWVIDSDGKNEICLSPSGAHPAWSPDCTQICYIDFSDGKVWIMNADGTNKKRLSTNKGWLPEWSIDGRFIIFEDQSNKEGIFIIGVDGTNEHLITDKGHAPSWIRTTK